MKVRRLDRNHDFTFGSSKANYALESDAVLQCVKTILLSFRENWFLDLDHGIAWFDYFVKNPDVTEMERDLRQNITGVIGVKSIEDLQLLLDTVTRRMTVIVKYTDIYGNQTMVDQIVRDN